MDLQGRLLQERRVFGYFELLDMSFANNALARSANVAEPKLFTVIWKDEIRREVLGIKMEVAA